MLNLTNVALSGMSRTAYAMLCKLLAHAAFIYIAVRLISPEVFGAYAIALLIYTFSSGFSSLGLQQSLIRQSTINDGHWRSCLIICALNGVSVAALVWMLREQIGELIGFEGLSVLLSLMAFSISIATIIQVPIAKASRDYKFGYVAVVDVVSIVLGNFGFVILAVINGLDPILALGLGHLLEHMIRLLLYLSFVKKIAFHGEVHIRNVVCLLKEGGWFSVARYANLFATKVDSLIVGLYVGQSALGLYSRSYEVMAIPSSMYQKIADKVVFPVMSRASGSPQRVVRGYLGGVGFTATFALPVSIGIILLAEPLTALIFGGGEWAEVQSLIPVFAIGVYFRMSYRVAATALRATGLVRYFAQGQIIYAGIVVVLCFAGSPFGAVGIACGAVMAVSLNFLLQTWLVHKALNVGVKSFFQAHMLGIALAMLWLPLWPMHVWLSTSASNSFYHIAPMAFAYFTLVALLIATPKVIKLLIGENPVMTRVLSKIRLV